MSLSWSHSLLTAFGGVFPNCNEHKQKKNEGHQCRSVFPGSSQTFNNFTMNESKLSHLQASLCHLLPCPIPDIPRLTILMVLLFREKRFGCPLELGEALSSKSDEFSPHQLSQWWSINVCVDRWTCSWGCELPFALSFNYLSYHDVGQFLSQCQWNAQHIPTPTVTLQSYMWSSDGLKIRPCYFSTVFLEKRY